MHSQLQVKEKEIHNVQEKINQGKKDLKAQGKRKKTDNEKLEDLEKKVKKNEALSKELIKEIKALKKL